MIVASPPATHPDVVEPLLRAGVPVMCEKPIAVDLATARRLAARRRGDRHAARPWRPSSASSTTSIADPRADRDRRARRRSSRSRSASPGRVDMAGRWNSEPGHRRRRRADRQRHPRRRPGPLPGRRPRRGLHGHRPGRAAAGRRGLGHAARRAPPPACSPRSTSPGRSAGSRRSTARCTAPRARSRSAGPGARAATGGRREPYAFGSGYGKITRCAPTWPRCSTALAEGEPLPVTAADAVAAAAVIEAGLRLGGRGTVDPTARCSRDDDDAFVHPTALVEDERRRSAPGTQRLGQRPPAPRRRRRHRLHHRRQVLPRQQRPHRRPLQDQRDGLHLLRA